MTEQQFRCALNQAIGDAGLPDVCRQNVLARMKGNEPPAIKKSKLRFVLVLAVVLLLLTVTAMAAGGRYINWNAERTAGWETPQISSRAENALKLIVRREDHQAVWITWPATDTEPGGGTGDRRAVIHTGDLTQAGEVVKTYGGVPWVTTLPAGYALQEAWICYSSTGCYTEGTMEKTPDGFTVRYYSIPKEDRCVEQYTLKLENEAGHELLVGVYMHFGDGDRTFGAAEEMEAFTLPLTNGEPALIMNSAGQMRVALRQTMMTPVSLQGVPGAQEHVTFTGVTMELSTTDPALRPADLLAVYGLTIR